MVKVSLKAILQNFLNHFETLESRKLCHEDDLYLREFQALKDLTESLKNDVKCCCDEGEKDVNRRKNRYKDILPYDHSRVILSEYPGVPGSDYINANYVRGSSGSSCAYIASQGPLPNTVVDFWRMIWECDVSVIVMACNEREAGKYKCECYWPGEGDGPEQYGNITVQMVKWKQVCPDFLVRTLKVKTDEEERTVCQFHYTTWPDHGVPNSVHPILELVRLMRDVQVSESRPLLIHCSAGCGRTGTICSIDYVWALLRTGKLKEDFSLHAIISDMRRQRIAMVQTVEQYMLCYKAVATLFEQQLKMIDTHTYENIAEDGEPLVLKELLEDADGTQSSASSSRNEKRDESDKRSVESVPSSRTSHSLPENKVKPTIPITLIQPDETRHERLIGKATVIRRPSIAKLKAIFENQANNSQQAGDTLSRRPATSTLHRSQSTKEPTNMAMRSHEQELHQHQSELINDGVMCNNLMQNLQLTCGQNNHPKQMHQQEQLYVNHLPVDQATTALNSQKLEIVSSTNLFIPHQLQPSNHLNHHIPSFNYPVAVHSLVSHQPTSSAPPKPPRTYQHYANEVENPYDVPTNNGRVIVSIALPKRPTNNEPNPEPIYEPLVRRCNMSAPNLMNEALSCGTDQLNKTKEISERSANNNFYETVIQQNLLTQKLPLNAPNLNNAYFDIIRMNSGNRTVPIYEPIANRQNFIPNSMSQNFKPVNMTVPTQTHAVAPFTGQRPTYENIYSLGNCKINNNLHCSVRPTVTYVKPNALHANSVSNPVLIKGPNKIVKSASTSFVHPSANAKSNSKTVKRDSKSANNNNISSSSHQTNNSFSLFSNAFRGFRKKKGPKNKVKPANNNNVVSTSNGNAISNGQTIRPPHSHRFSPPTQWTQV